MPGNNDPARTLTPSAGLPGSQLVPGRETAGSWPATQHRARHARAPAGQEGTSGHGQVPAAMPPRPPSSKPAAEHGQAEVQQARRKPAVTRRAMLGLAAATTAGLAAAGWDLSHRTATPGRTPAPHPSGGTPLWTTTIPNNGIGWGPTVAEGIIYLGDQGQPSGLYALSASDGHMLWHHRGAAQVVPQEGNVTVTSKTVYTLTDNGQMDYGVAAYNARTGATSWELASIIKGGGPVNGPTITDGVLYLADHGYGQLYALNPASGRSLWTFTFPTYGTVGGLAASGQTAYVAYEPGSLYAIRSGQQIWRFRFTTSGVITADPTIAGDLVYVIHTDGNLYALHTDDGHEVLAF